MLAEDDPAAAVEREIALRTGASGATDAQIGQLLGLARQVDFAAGEVVRAAGAPSDHVLLLIDGEVELVADDGDAPPWRASPGATLGVLDALIARPSARTTRARSPVRALEIHVDDYFAYLHDNIELCQAMITEFAGALHRAVLALPDPGALLDGANEPCVDAPERPFAVVDRVLLIRQVAAFRRASVQALVSLAARATVVQAAAGEVLFTEGDPSETIWMVARGGVELTRAAAAFRLRRGPAELVTHLAELSTGPRAYTATAACDSVLLRIHREDLLDRLEEHFELARSILAFLAAEREKLNDLLASLGAMRLSRV